MTIAVNIEVAMPIIKVTENPLIGPLPNENKAKAANKVVKLASTIVEIALWNPASIASRIFLPELNYSFILSKIKTFASTAIPTVKIIPAIPGRVSVASKMVKMPININKLEIKATLATKPKILYL